MTATAEQIVDAVGRVCARQRDASPLAVWNELFAAGHAQHADLAQMTRRLHTLARTRRIDRHRREGERRPYFRPAGTPMPLFCRPIR